MKKLIYILFLLCPAVLFAQPYTLEQCKKMAVDNNFKLKNSRIDYQMANETKKEAFTKYFPSVSATGMTFRASEFLINESIDMTLAGKILASMGMNPATLGIPSALPIQKMKNGTIGMISAIQPVFAGGQIVNGNKLAKVGCEVSKLKITLSENEVISETENYFWQIVALKEKLKTIDVAGKQLEEIHKTVTAAVNAGVRTRNDLLRVELQQQNIESNRVKVENGIKIYKLLLCNQTGVNKDNFDIALSEFSLVKNPTEYYIDSKEGFQRRSEKQLLDKGVEAANLQKKMTIGKNMPTVAVGAGYLYHNLLDKDTDLGLVFATVSIPISSWWGGSHEIRNENFNILKAENERKDMQELMGVEIESKWNELQESYLQINIAQKSIDASTENLRLNKDYYSAGTVSLMDLLDAQTILQQSRDQYTDACTTYFLKLLTYMQVTGR
jgi:outer membrane protein